MSWFMGLLPPVLILWLGDWYVNRLTAAVIGITTPKPPDVGWSRGLCGVLDASRSARAAARRSWPPRARAASQALARRPA
jgi:hypothetical protein